MRRRGRPKHPDILTPREWEVLALIRQGHSNEAIAERLGISISGAKYHVSEILAKLEVSSRDDAARWREQATPAIAVSALLSWKWLSRGAALTWAGISAASVAALTFLLIAAHGSATQNEAFVVMSPEDLARCTKPTAKYVLTPTVTPTATPTPVDDVRPGDFSSVRGTATPYISGSSSDPFMWCLRGAVEIVERPGTTFAGLRIAGTPPTAPYGLYPESAEGGVSSSLLESPGAIPLSGSAFLIGRYGGADRGPGDLYVFQLIDSELEALRRAAARGPVHAGESGEYTHHVVPVSRRDDLRVGDRVRVVNPHALESDADAVDARFIYYEFVGLDVFRTWAIVEVPEATAWGRTPPVAMRKWFLASGIVFDLKPLE